MFFLKDVVLVLCGLAKMLVMWIYLWNFIFKTKLQEHFKNKYFADLGNISKLATYSTFNTEFEPERYLNF